MAQKTIAGKSVDVGDDGHMTDLAQWTREIAVEIAKAEGLPTLTEGHWKVIDYLQTQFKASGNLPTIRGLKNSGVVPVKDLYDLFPGGPLKKATKIAGLKKPESCV
jgi:tRNA 2-thiouridine synthesizing protein E